MTNMTVIEFANKRLMEEIAANDQGKENMFYVNYWRAYLDGAKAQAKEDEKL